MTRKHFKAIAATIARARMYDHDTQILDLLVYDMCVTLATFNPHFNASKFIEACGVQDDQ